MLHISKYCCDHICRSGQCGIQPVSGHALQVALRMDGHHLHIQADVAVYQHWLGGKH